MNFSVIRYVLFQGFENVYIDQDQATAHERAGLKKQIHRSAGESVVYNPAITTATYNPAITTAIN